MSVGTIGLSRSNVQVGVRTSRRYKTHGSGLVVGSVKNILTNIFLSNTTYQLFKNIHVPGSQFFVYDDLVQDPVGTFGTPTPPTLPFVHHNLPVSMDRAQRAAEKETPDEVQELWKKFNTTVDATYLSPSQSCKTINYKKNQERTPLLDGRYGDSGSEKSVIAPPIELYHPVFAQFKAGISKSCTPELDIDIVLKTFNFMNLFTEASYSLEPPSSAKVRKALSALLSFSLIDKSNFDISTPGYLALTPRVKYPIEPAVITFIEQKSGGELGVSGDAAVHGSFSYLQYWIDDQRKGLRELCCCPSFIIGISGSWMTILGAAFTTGVIVQRLTGYVCIKHDSLGDGAILGLAQIFQSLRTSMAHLKTYYDNLEGNPATPTNNSRFFPTVSSFGDVKFAYVKPLEPSTTCTTFLATRLDTNEKIVVKFSGKYGEAAHALLESKGMAPKLFYCGPISPNGPDLSYGSLKLIVMEYVDGQSIWTKFTTKGKRIPPQVLGSVKKALTYLQNEGMVHGDLRPPNIFIREGAPVGLEESEVVIIDFDWAGKEGEARYPLNLSRNIQWPGGVKDYEFIKSEHDTEMINRL